MTRKLRVLGLVLGAFAMFALVACSGDDDGGDNDTGNEATQEAPAGGDAEAVEVTLGQPSELAIEAGASAAAGSISFEVSNGGALPHELVVVKTDEAADALPVDGAAVDESGLDIVARSAMLDPGAEETVTADLEAGSYVLFCNVPGHYAGGMRAAFTVQ